MIVIQAVSLIMIPVETSVRITENCSCGSVIVSLRIGMMVHLLPVTSLDPKVSMIVREM